MKRLLIAVLVLSALGASLEAYAEQKIVECGERYRFKTNYGTEEMTQDVCKKVCATSKIEDYLKDGWKIDSNQPTTFTPKIGDSLAMELSKDMLKNHGVNFTAEMVGWISEDCVCLGTKYVLSKVEKKVEVAPEPDKNLELMKKEIELLKKENDMLKKDSEALKQENEALKKKAAKKK